MRQLLSSSVMGSRVPSNDDAVSDDASSSSSSNIVEELTTRIKETRMQLRTALRTQFVTAVNYTEGMVLDDVLRTAVKIGNEFTMGIMGGMVLYSLPLEELFGEDDGFEDGNNDGEEGQVKNRMIVAMVVVAMTMRVANSGRRAKVSIDSYDTLESMFLDNLILLPRY